MEDVTELSHQFGISVIVVHVLEWLKNSPMAPMITPATTVFVRLLAMAIAAATSIGFKVALTSGDFSSGGVITIGFPALATVVDVLIHTVAQYGAQKGYYHLAIRQTDVDALKAVVTDLAKDALPKP
jgi:hypothetical protein